MNNTYTYSGWNSDIIHVSAAKGCKVVSTIIGVTKCPWPWPFKIKMTYNGQTNPKNNKSWIFIMADGGHIGFGHSEIRGRVASKHLDDFVCLWTHELSSSEKFSQHHFANGSTGQVQYYLILMRNLHNHYQIIHGSVSWQAIAQTRSKVGVYIPVANLLHSDLYHSDVSLYHDDWVLISGYAVFAQCTAMLRSTLIYIYTTQYRYAIYR